MRVENRDCSFRVTGWVEASAMCALSEGVSFPSVERSGADVEVIRKAVTLLTTERWACRADAELLTFCAPPGPTAKSAGYSRQVCKVWQPLFSMSSVNVSQI